MTYVNWPKIDLINDTHTHIANATEKIIFNSIQFNPLIF